MTSKTKIDQTSQEVGQNHTKKWVNSANSNPVATKQINRILSSNLILRDIMFLKGCTKIQKERQLKIIMLTNLKEVKVGWVWM